MTAREGLVRLGISVAAVAVAIVSSMFLRLIIWPGLEWSEGRITVALVLWVATGAVGWFAGVMAFIHVIARLLEHRAQRHFPAVVAGCTVAGLVIGSILRRILFQEPWEGDYPLQAYAVLYVVGLLAAVAGVWLASNGPTEHGTSRP